MLAVGQRDEHGVDVDRVEALAHPPLRSSVAHFPDNSSTSFFVRVDPSAGGASLTKVICVPKTRPPSRRTLRRHSSGWTDRVRRLRVDRPLLHLLFHRQLSLGHAPPLVLLILLVVHDAVQLLRRAVWAWPRRISARRRHAQMRATDSVDMRARNGGIVDKSGARRRAGERRGSFFDRWKVLAAAGAAGPRKCRQQKTRPTESVKSTRDRGEPKPRATRSTGGLKGHG